MRKVSSSTAPWLAAPQHHGASPVRSTLRGTCCPGRVSSGPTRCLQDSTATPHPAGLSATVCRSSRRPGNRATRSHLRPHPRLVCRVNSAPAGRPTGMAPPSTCLSPGRVEATQIVGRQVRACARAPGPPIVCVGTTTYTHARLAAAFARGKSKRPFIRAPLPASAAFAPVFARRPAVRRIRQRRTGQLGLHSHFGLSLPRASARAPQHCLKRPKAF